MLENLMTITFAVLTVEQAVGQFHPIFLHFPIVLFTAALIADLLNYFGKKRAFVAGHWLIIIGVITCIPTIITGLAAEVNFNPNDYLLQKHRSLGFATGISGSLYAGLRISTILWNLSLKPIHYLFLSVLLVALVSWTSDYGGLITRGVTPFSDTNPVTSMVTSERIKNLLESDIIISGPTLKLNDQLKQNIALNDVIPIFAENHCEQCHAKCFSNGVPNRFYEGKHPFLERNSKGGLGDYTLSNFYKTVILANEMPIDEKGNPIGLSSSERLILLCWLQNGAPMEQPSYQ